MNKLILTAVFLALCAAWSGLARGEEAAANAGFKPQAINVSAETNISAPDTAAIHMATNGLDANSGAVESPVATLPKAIQLAEQRPVPCEIVIHGGTYFLTNTVTISRSKKESRLVIRSADNETAIFDGSVPLARAEPLAGATGVYAVKGDFPGDNPPAVWDAGTGRHFAKLAAADSVQATDYSSVILDERTMAIRCRDGLSPAQGDIRMAWSGVMYGFRILRDNVTIRGITFQNFISVNGATGITIGPNLAGSGRNRQGVFTTNTVVDSCLASNCYFGFHVSVGSAGALITRSRMRNNVTGLWISGVDTVVENCEIVNDPGYKVPGSTPNEQSGIRFYNKPEDAVIRGNLISNFRGGIASKGSPGKYIIENNTVVNVACALQLDLGFLVRHNIFAGIGNTFQSDYPMKKDTGNIDGNVFWGPRGLMESIKDPTWGCGTNNILADPLFAAPWQGDYRLLPGSPALRFGGDKCAGAFPQVPAGYQAPSKPPVTPDGGTGKKVGAGPAQASQAPQGTLKLEGRPRIVYVSDKGEDSEGSGSREKPFKTIQFALDRVPPCGRVRIMPGVYFGENRLENRGGTEQQPLVIEGLYPNTVFLDGLGEAGTLLKVASAPHSIVRNLNFRWYAGAGLVVINSKAARVTACRFQNQYWRTRADFEGRPALRFAASPNFMADHCVITRTRYQLELTDSPGGQILHNTFLAGAVTHIQWRGGPSENVTIKYNSLNWNGNQVLNISQPLDTLRNKCVIDCNNYGTTFQKPEGTETPRGKFGRSLPKPFPYLPNSREFLVYQDTTDPSNEVSRSFVNVEDWQKFSGQDKNSIFADPKWIDPRAGRFDVAADSPNLLPDGKIIGALGCLGGNTNMAPEVVVTSPFALEEIKGAITVAADASDYDGAVKKVEFYAGDKLVGETVKPPYQVTGVKLAKGSHVITARAIDDKGAETVSDGTGIKVCE